MRDLAERNGKREGRWTSRFRLPTTCPASQVGKYIAAHRNLLNRFSPGERASSFRPHRPILKGVGKAGQTKGGNGSVRWKLDVSILDFAVDLRVQVEPTDEVF